MVPHLLLHCLSPGLLKGHMKLHKLHPSYHPIQPVYPPYFPCLLTALMLLSSQANNHCKVSHKIHHWLHPEAPNS